MMWIFNSLVPRPSPSFPSLVVQLSGSGPGTFSHVSDVTGRKMVERLIERGPARLNCCCVSSLFCFCSLDCLVKSDIKSPSCAAIFRLRIP